MNQANGHCPETDGDLMTVTALSLTEKEVWTNYQIVEPQLGRIFALSQKEPLPEN